MKVLKVDGEDFAALGFKLTHSGTSVADIISDIDKYQPTEEDKEDEKYWELTVLGFDGASDDIDPELIKWIKSQIDDDTLKHEYYYFDNETV